MTRPTVSVIVPAYNTARYIADTIASVLAQTYKRFEIVVVNDGSPDTPALEAALAPFRERIHYIVQPNRGLSGARNTGIAAARGELVALLDSDDIWEPDYLACQIETLTSRGLDVVYPNAINFGDPRRAGRLFMDVHPSSGPVTLESLVTQQCNVMVSVLARRDVLADAGLFDESLRSSEDFDMWLRVVARGGRIGYDTRPLVRSRLRPESLSANEISMCQHIVRVLDKTTRTMTLTPAQADLIADRRAHFMALLRFHEGKRAFVSGNREQALAALTEANVRLKRVKIAVAIVLLRVMPNLLLRAYDARDRLVFRTSTR